MTASFLQWRPAAVNPGLRRRLAGLALVWVASTTATAHPSSGYIRLRAEDCRFEVRMTLALSALSELATMDANSDGTITRQEIAGTLPQIRDRLAAGLALQINGNKSPLGQVTAVDSLWPKGREAGGNGGLPLEACFMDITFGLVHAQPIRSFTMDFGALFLSVPSLSSIEGTCRLGDGGESTVALNRSNAIAGIADRPADPGPSLVRDLQQSPVAPAARTTGLPGSWILGLCAALLSGLGILGAFLLKRRKPRSTTQ